MAEQRQLDYELLSSYLADETTSVEDTVIEEWVNADPERKLWREEAARSWNAMPDEVIPPFNVNSFYARLQRHIQSRTQATNVALETPFTAPVDRARSRSSRGSIRSGTVIRSVAGLVAIGAVAVIAWFGGINNLSSNLSNTTSIYTTARGERANITLPDGSTVVLNVASRLEVPSDFAAGARNVKLSGEALFSIKHAAGTPFTVYAGPSTTRVLGTTFAVRHYEDDSSAVISVNDGKVLVGDSVVTANQQIRSSAFGQGAVQPSSNAPFTFAQGVMTLENTTLIDAIPAISRWYDVDVRIGDPVIDRTSITGEFSAGSVAELMQILEWTFDIKVIKRGRVLTLFPK